MIITSDQLIKKIAAYNPMSDKDLIAKAYQFCKDAHSGQFRKSGEPYYSHPVAVADYMADMKFDDVSIVVSLLHDVLEDTPVTQELLRLEFSSEIASLVDGVTTLETIKFRPDHIKQAENFRKLFIALARDIRVLIIKLCDRLHNMRTIQWKSSRLSQRRTAIESLEIYAPLAEQVGMYQIRDELQDLGFQVINNNARKSLLNRMKVLYGKSSQAIMQLQSDLRQILQDRNIYGTQILSREKTAYSVWKKMDKKSISLNQIDDLIGLRIIVKDVDDCYRALGVIHREYKAIRGQFVDYISLPKSNGYESIHTAVMTNFGKIEIQIRTLEMDYTANYGLATHWSYKHGIPKLIDSENEVMLWIKKVLAILNDSTNATDFLESTKLELYHDRLFVFVDNDQIVNLPNNATVLDIAFAMNEQSGLSCAGAIINGVKVDITHQPSNGDRIEIIVSKDVVPHVSWLQYVHTGLANAAIKKHTRKIGFNEQMLKGSAILTNAMNKYNMNPNLLHLAPMIASMNDINDVYNAIANDVIDPIELVKNINAYVKDSANTSSSQHNHQMADDTIVAQHSHASKPRLADIKLSCCDVSYDQTLVPVIIPNIGVAWHAKNCTMLY